MSTDPANDNAPTANTEPGTSMQNGIAKGSGSAVFTAQTVFAPDFEDPSCSDTPLPVAGALTTIIVLTYNDGSILTLSTAGGSGSFCTDGIQFDADLSGTVTNGSGRFEGAAGSWSGTAQVSGSQITGDFTVDFE